MFSKIRSHIIKNLSIILSVTAIFSSSIPTTSAMKHDDVPTTFYISLEQQLERRAYWRRYVRRMPEKSVKEQLDYEIARYKHRAPDIFKISERLIEKSDPRILLIDISTLNYLFDKYSTFTKQFIEFKRHRQQNFFNLTTNTEYETVVNGLTDQDIGIDAFTTPSLVGIVLNRTHDLDKAIRLIRHENSINRKTQSRNNYYSSISPWYECERTITHEFGHVMAMFYIINKYKIDVPEIDRKTAEKLIPLARDLTERLEKIDAENPRKTISGKKPGGKIDLSNLNSLCPHKDCCLNPYLEKLLCEVTSEDSNINPDLKKLLNEAFEKHKATSKDSNINPELVRAYATAVAIIDFKKGVDNLLDEGSLEKLPDEKTSLKSITEKSKPIKEALTKNLDTEDKRQCPMGAYGNSDPQEFIAEAFAHLECSNPKDVSKLGKETERFIVEEMKFLPKERAIFPENK